jgi:alpha-tubulin suppressor-like RCC1 family protein
MPAQALTFSNATATAAGMDHGVAIDTGAVYTWGSNAVGQIGNNSTSTVPVTTPFKVSSLTGTYTQVSCGMNYTLALRSNGDVFAWGQNSFGQIGTGGTSSSVNLPTQVTVLDKATAIAAGGGHGLALRTDLVVTGAVWAWGANMNGQLGNGRRDPRRSPRRSRC